MKYPAWTYYTVIQYMHSQWCCQGGLWATSAPLLKSSILLNPSRWNVQENTHRGVQLWGKVLPEIDHAKCSDKGQKCSGNGQMFSPFHVTSVTKISDILWRAANSSKSQCIHFMAQNQTQSVQFYRKTHTKIAKNVFFVVIAIYNVSVTCVTSEISV